MHFNLFLSRNVSMNTESTIQTKDKPVVEGNNEIKVNELKVDIKTSPKK
jgi:hypothetical protein